MANKENHGTSEFGCHSDSSLSSTNSLLSDSRSRSERLSKFDIEELERAANKSPEPNFKCFFNSLGSASGFRTYPVRSPFKRSFAHEITEKFGSNSNIVLSCQNYQRLGRSNSLLQNIVEIFKIQEGTTDDDILATYGDLLAEVVRMSDTTLLLIFGCEQDANTAVRIQSPLFQSRKLLYSSFDVINFAINFVYSKDGPKLFHLKTHEKPTLRAVLSRVSNLPVRNFKLGRNRRGRGAHGDGP